MSQMLITRDGRKFQWVERPCSFDKEKICNKVAKFEDGHEEFPHPTMCNNCLLVINNRLLSKYITILEKGDKNI